MMCNLAVELAMASAASTVFFLFFFTEQICYIRSSEVASKLI